MPVPIVGVMIGVAVVQGAFNYFSNKAAINHTTNQAQGLLNGQSAGAIHAENAAAIEEFRNGSDTNTTPTTDNDSASDDEEDSNMNAIYN